MDMQVKVDLWLQGKHTEESISAPGRSGLRATEDFRTGTEQRSYGEHAATGLDFLRQVEGVRLVFEGNSRTFYSLGRIRTLVKIFTKETQWSLDFYLRGGDGLTGASSYGQDVGQDTAKAADKAGSETANVAMKTAHGTEKAADATVSGTKKAAEATASGTKKAAKATADTTEKAVKKTGETVDKGAKDVVKR
jgi:hypothetical protein